MVAPSLRKFLISTKRFKARVGHDYSRKGTPTTTFTHFLAPSMIESLKLLQEEGFIKTVQGMGSQISRQAHFDFPVSQLTSYQEIVKASGLRSETNVIRLEKISIDEKGAKKTGFPLHRLVWKVTRQRVVDRVASVLDIDYLDRELIPGLTRKLPSTLSSNI